MSEARADRLAELVRGRDLDALLVTNLVNVRWATGFTGTNGVCALGEDLRTFWTDFRSVSQAPAQVPGVERARGKQDLLGDVAERLRGRVGFDDTHMTVRARERLAGLVGDGVELVPAGGLVEELRGIKDEDELSAMRDAARLADEALGSVLEGGLAGRSEREFARSLERTMEDLGSEGRSFPSIVAAGPHGALPHAEPRDVEIPRDTLVIVDWGAIVDGYCSDCTRTFATGALPDAAADVYELVRATQAEARDAVRPGADVREVDGVARKLIEEAGHGEHFGHGLGHGVGLEVHEAPRLSPLGEGELRVGQAVTVEPGVYVDGEFGVRVEDLVVVTDDGCESLSSLPKELTTV